MRHMGARARARAIGPTTAMHTYVHMLQYTIFHVQSSLSVAKVCPR